MSRLEAIKDTAAEQRIFLQRVALAAVFVMIASGAVIARLTQLQVFDHQYYSELSAGNQIRLEAAPPTRGLILDRNGVVLAENLPVYQLEMIAEQVPDVSESLDSLESLGLIHADDIDRIDLRRRRTAPFNPVLIKSRMTESEVALFAQHRPYFQGIDIRARLVRHYPHATLAAHALGYVGGMSPNDLSRVDRTNYKGTAYIGKTGIERAFEDVLHGNTGNNAVITTAEGRAVSFEPRVEPTPGRNIYLTLDIELQRVAEKALDGRRGAIVALDPNNGDVLAIVSAPAFDPNAFTSGMNSQDFSLLQRDLDQPLFNRAIAGRYPPGSTIKPVLAFGALDSERTSDTTTINCEGYFSLPGSTHRYRDWKPEGHGLVDLKDAIAQSCDVYFYQLAQDMDIDLMHDYLVEFGLGPVVGIEIPGEKPGLVPSREWKQQRFSRRADRVWFPGETVIASIGQGYMLATPLQLAHIAGTLGTRGQRFKPRITLAFEDAISGDRTPVAPVVMPPVQRGDQHTWTHTIEAMQDVMQSVRGSAYATGRDAGYGIAGKSGTAQVFSVAQEDKYDDLELDERLKDHALFIAFAPVEAPRIAVAVIVENGSSGSTIAAPIARAITDSWLQR